MKPELNKLTTATTFVDLVAVVAWRQNKISGRALVETMMATTIFNLVVLASRQRLLMVSLAKELRPMNDVFSQLNDLLNDLVQESKNEKEDFLFEDFLKEINSDITS